LGGISGAGVLFGQLERLLIPKLLTMAELASFSVLAALVIAPYRIFQMGATFTVLPRVRSLQTVSERRRLVVRESLSMILIVVLTSTAMLTLTPWIMRAIFAGKYEFSTAVILAGIWTGSLRAFSGLSKGITLALCTDSELAGVNMLLWICIGVAVAGGFVGARWGLAGVIFGSGAGWLTMTCGYAYVALRHLRGERAS
jgi:hypothetical protein